MNRFYSYINTAAMLIKSYKGETPFAIFIKQFFVSNKKHGSRDRKQIASLCYNYFRLGYSLANASIEDKMLTGTFLCEQESSPFMEQLRPEWNTGMPKPIENKFEIAGGDFLLTDIFPFSDELSNDVDAIAFSKAFLIQPNLFLRIRPLGRSNTLKKLERSKLPFKWMNENCIQIEPSIKVSDFFIVDKEVVIQDYNSQQVFNYFKGNKLQADWLNLNLKEEFSVWDCCAGSGGKSILLCDILKTKINLTISDIRASIISNLHQRFIRAGIKEYKYFIADLGDIGFQLPANDFDIIICDAPCTGSGTWSRTPEQLSLFKRPEIDKYSSQQKKLVTNIIPHIKIGGMLIYITCSVFRKENEEIVKFISIRLDCQLQYVQLLKGYDKKADSMFVAIFNKVTIDKSLN